mgnify:CR=1 FL=1
MDPQQELFSAVLMALKEKYEDKTYTFTVTQIYPPEDTPYPFVYLADCSESDQATKNEIIGETNLTLKVWHDNIRQRGTVSGILADIKKICRSIEHTAHYAWNMQRPTQRILPDNTTKQPLLMGVLVVGYKFS